MPQQGRTALYRFYDASEVLLYVGITDCPERRWREHSEEKFWWHLVARKTVTWFSTRAEAEAAETQAIADESPVHDRTWRQHRSQEFRDTHPPLRDPFAGPLTEKLRQQILSGALPPGSEIQVTPELAVAHGVSLASVRSALLRLREERLITQGRTIRPRRGRRVYTYVVRAVVVQPVQV